MDNTYNNKYVYSRGAPGQSTGAEHVCRITAEIAEHRARAQALNRLHARVQVHRHT